MDTKFPCGASGKPEYCPNLCSYGKFCKIKDQYKPEPRGLQEEKPEENETEDFKIEIY